MTRKSLFVAAAAASATLVLSGLLLSGAIMAGSTMAVSGSRAAPDPATALHQAVVASVPGVGSIRYTLAPSGNEARYRVREQLAGFDFPNDAVGTTRDLSGAVVLDSAGRIVRSESRFVVNLTTLVSDRERRDRFIQGRTLQTADHPTVTLVPTALEGLSNPLPESGTRTFTLHGDLTVRGVTGPTIWRVSASFLPGQVTGAASTAFTFADLDIDKPRVASVLSVADTIRLEYDFTLVSDGGAATR